MLSKLPLAATFVTLLFWAWCKLYAVAIHVLVPDEYSDTYYYFLQAKAAVSGGGLAGMTPEYPTPAAALLLVPWALGGHEPEAYRHYFLLLVVVVDAVFVLVLARFSAWQGILVWTLFETHAARTPVLRFDIVPAVLAASGLFFLLKRRDAPASGLFVVGAALKLWPALLLPLTLGHHRSRTRAATIAGIASVLVAFVSLVAGGLPRLISPLAFQRDRGLQIESVAATPAMLARLTNPDYQISWSSNAYEITGPTVDWFLGAASLAGFAALACGVALVVRWFSTGADPDAAAYLSLFAVGAFMATSRALSPQYLLWIAALVSALFAHAASDSLDDEGGRRRIRLAWLAFAWTLALDVLTTFVYPIAYDDVLNNQGDPVLALALRNGLLVGFAVWTGLTTWRLSAGADG